jgi:glycerol-3-phosphate dehydrogenase
VLFVIPWGRHWIIGTTDTDWDLDKAHPAASSRADIDYLLEHVNRVLREPLDHEDVEGVYAGLRPLLSGESEPTSRISREHTVVTPVPGLVMIAGGKLTTYRVMAKDAVDAAARRAGRPSARLDHRPGAAARRRRLRDPHQPARACSRGGPASRRPDRPPAGPVRRPDRRPARADREAPARARRAARGRRGLPRAEVVYAVTHEGARTSTTC